jgi:pathogenesis-related protein 1
VKAPLFVFAVALFCSGAASPPEKAGALDQQQIDLMVARHNVWRAKVGCKPVTWSKDLASYAQEWSDHLAKKGCKMKHREEGQYGENIYWSKGMKNEPGNIVDSWASEIENYNEKRNDCKAGEMCGHYTQIVWCKTTEIGCGTARCGDEEVWVCNYNPPGNWVGERPY